METKEVASEALQRGIWLLGSSAEATGEAADWTENGQVRSSVWVTSANESRFARHANLPINALRKSLAIEAVWLADGAREEDLAPAMYRALQIGRIRDCNTVVAHLPELSKPVGRVLRLAELNASPELRSGASLVASAQMLDVAIHEVARRVSSSAWTQLRPGLSSEVLDTVRHWLPRFYGGSWTRSIIEKTMTREQYVQSLSNMHHYVRQTTQHLGRAVANAEDRNLRRHLVHHLTGEINHEVMIENDLRHMGVDPEYVIRHRTPSAATKEFMALQEASVGFYHDPLMLMGCALVLEGIAAHLPAEFVPRLRELASAWGVEHPERATSFITSHVHTDGGEEGHFEAAAEMLGSYLLDEATQRRFLCTVRAAADCIERLFNSNIDDLPLFAGVA